MPINQVSEDLASHSAKILKSKSVNKQNINNGPSIKIKHSENIWNTILSIFYTLIIIQSKGDSFKQRNDAIFTSLEKDAFDFLLGFETIL